MIARRSKDHDTLFLPCRVLRVHLAKRDGGSEARGQITELRAKITKWQANQDKLKTLLEQMRKDKSGILEKLVQLGIRSEDDLIGNPKGQVLMAS